MSKITLGERPASPMPIDESPIAGQYTGTPFRYAALRIPCSPFDRRFASLPRRERNSLVV